MQKDTKTDILLGTILLPTMFVSTIGSMYVTAAFLVPWILKITNCVPKSTEETIIGVTVTFISMLFGIFIFILIVKLTALFLVNEKTYIRWKSAFRAHEQQSKGLNKGLAKIITPLLVWAVKPRVNTSSNKALKIDAAKKRGAI